MKHYTDKPKNPNFEYKIGDTISGAASPNDKEYQLLLNAGGKDACGGCVAELNPTLCWALPRCGMNRWVDTTNIPF